MKEETKPTVIRKIEFEYRDVSKCIALFAPTEFRGKEQLGLFFFRIAFSNRELSTVLLMQKIKLIVWKNEFEYRDLYLLTAFFGNFRLSGFGRETNMFFFKSPPQANGCPLRT